jgi:hypothetical protein
MASVNNLLVCVSFSAACGLGSQGSVTGLWAPATRLGELSRVGSVPASDHSMHSRTPVQQHLRLQYTVCLCPSPPHTHTHTHSTPNYHVSLPSSSALPSFPLLREACCAPRASGGGGGCGTPASNSGRTAGRRRRAGTRLPGVTGVLLDERSQAARFLALYSLLVLLPPGACASCRKEPFVWQRAGHVSVSVGSVYRGMVFPPPRCCRPHPTTREPLRAASLRCWTPCLRCTSACSRRRPPAP